MSEELLKLDKLPTVGEFSYLLLNLLAGNHPVLQYDIGIICKSSSLNFALSFDNSIKFLSILSIITVHENNSISRIIDNDLDQVQGDQALCIFITKRLVEHLHQGRLLDRVFNSKIVSFDVHKDTFCVHANAMPLDCPMIKHYLINMGIAYPDPKSKGRILINGVYKPFFQQEVLHKVVKTDEGTSIAQIDIENELKPTMSTISLFISYAHKDELIKIELVKHLSGIKKMGLINEWNDRMIQPGEKWDEAIKDKLEKANIILCLISADFMASDYINDVEIKNALERRERGEVKIIPIIVRPCDFDSFPVSQYQALPKDAKPISKWDDQDEALLDVVKSLKKILL